MRVLHITPLSAQPVEDLPSQPPTTGFYWVSCTRAEFEAQLPAIQSLLIHVGGAPLVDLHVSDLLNPALPSNYDYTSRYDILVFRRLANAHLPPLTGSHIATTPAAPASLAAPLPAAASPTTSAPASHQPAHSQRDAPVLQRVETQPVGFALFDQILLSIHPEDNCFVQDNFWQRLISGPVKVEGRQSSGKLPVEPADLMLRMVNGMVDGYLDLRRTLTRQIDHWQIALLKPHKRFSNWASVLDVRLALHQLDEICEDQRAAMQDWTEALEGWPSEHTPARQHERELLRVRSRDVLEHIERVTHHIHRMEQSAETAVQMHFSAQSNRANDIMRTLTTVTAIFLPLNLIAGIFGMNFEFIPFVHNQKGFLWALLAMALITVLLVAYFWRRRYLESEEKE
ncbi:magnesium transporter CorA family protein [Comamonas sp. Y33R10-2]|uniref:magnesium transporter CorA family protein n=1 Tax=Comamonas sp. Y33R10-2 TaxID=2853257 RepID=UPI001C5CBE3B|nr:magnesium transporter CorA family protein [Comamonas sp. Y33R10-2]QXZ08897.1 magnesium transporter CorA family protein [Comamonas sp. Y33R10-2]